MNVQPKTTPRRQPPQKNDLPTGDEAIDRHVAGDITYVMFSDGAVEVRSPDGGAQRFASIQALREAAAAEGK